MKILVTGAAGFLGSWLCEQLLDSGHEVRAMVHYNIDKITHLKDKLEIFKADIRFADECFEACRDMDAVVNLAACIHVDRSRRYPGIFYETNVDGLRKLLDACRREDAQLVQMSTCEVLGNIPSGKADEDYPFTQPLSPYAASKHAAESYCYSYYRAYDIPINVIRGFNLFGPRQKKGYKGSVIPIFIDRVLRGEPPTIFGSGEQTRDYVDVRDVARGVALILDSEYKGELFHLCSGVEISILELALKIIEVCGSNLKPIHSEGKPGELTRSVGDYSKAERLLGWNPEISFKQTLRNTVEYCREGIKSDSN